MPFLPSLSPHVFVHRVCEDSIAPDRTILVHSCLKGESFGTDKRACPNSVSAFQLGLVASISLDMISVQFERPLADSKF
jgi:hypothetical protein